MALRARREPATDRLSTPRGAALRTGPVYDPDAFGRFSEAIARFLGTGRFLAGQTILVAIWITLNTVGLVYHWDKYPFVLLNLAFSTQAAYAAPLILLAQNRQDERDRQSIERDREVAGRTQADTEFLARELSAVRLSVADTVTTEDLDRALERIEEAIVRLEARMAPAPTEAVPAPTDGVPARADADPAATGVGAGPAGDPPDPPDAVVRGGRP